MLIKGTLNLYSYYVNQVGDQLLASFPTRLPLMGLAEIDFSLVRDPYFNPSTGISFFCKGEVYNLQNPVVRHLQPFLLHAYILLIGKNLQEAPFSPESMPYSQTGEMLQLFVSDYVLNTAGFALYKSLQYNLTDQVQPGISLMIECCSAVLNSYAQDLPSWSPLRLNTASWSCTSSSIT